MKVLKMAGVLFLVMSCSSIQRQNAEEAAIENRMLADLYRQDQSARKASVIDWKTLVIKDKERRNAVIKMLERGEIRSSRDYYHAAMIMQHGENISDTKLAFSFASISYALDAGNKDSAWLTAASWDRILMRENVPQWYGTQYYKPNKDSPMELYKVDESVITDEERKALDVPTLEQSRNRLKKH